MSQHSVFTHQQPHAHVAQIDDADVASALLGIHKTCAKTKMSAALEVSHPPIREMLVQGSVNSSHQAFEVWRYMERKGFYPLASLPDMTRAQRLGVYQPITQTMIDQDSPSARQTSPELLIPALDNTTMIKEELHVEGTISLGNLTQQVETKQPRGRKKSVSSELNLG
jgi:spore coat protein CotF